MMYAEAGDKIAPTPQPGTWYFLERYKETNFSTQIFYVSKTLKILKSILTITKI